MLVYLAILRYYPRVNSLFTKTALNIENYSIDCITALNTFSRMELTL